VDAASQEELAQLNRDYRELMVGYEPINGEKSVFYARKAIEISRRQGWTDATGDAARHIGQHFYALEQFDSALVYFRESLACVEKMAAGATSPDFPEGYSEKAIDDNRSALYGAIGNLYNVMGDIPTAMDYYRQAGEIFDKHGWNESNSVLYYNIGETWVEEKEYRKAAEAYEKSLEYATVAGDSLLAVNVYKGLGRLYLETGKTWKALPYQQKAEEYYSHHPEEGLVFRTENLEFLGKVLESQKRQMAWLIAGVILVVLLTAGIWAIGRRLRRARKEQAEAAEVMDETLEELRAVPTAQTFELKERERQVLSLLAEGKTNPQIAEALFLSPETIKWYRKKLLVKFDAPTSAALVSKAKDLGLV
jgi:DNA-binding CsgD family transcriptional regulator